MKNIKLILKYRDSDVLEHSGVDAFQSGNFQLSETLLESALVEAEAFEENGEIYLAKLNNLAAVYMIHGKFQEADQLFCRAVQLLLADKLLQSRHAVSVLKNYSTLMAKMQFSQFAEALSTCAEIMDSDIFRFKAHSFLSPFSDEREFEVCVA